MVRGAGHFFNGEPYNGVAPRFSVFFDTVFPETEIDGEIYPETTSTEFGWRVGILDRDYGDVLLVSGVDAEFRAFKGSQFARVQALAQDKAEATISYLLDLQITPRHAQWNPL